RCCWHGIHLIGSRYRTGIGSVGCVLVESDGTTRLRQSAGPTGVLSTDKPGCGQHNSRTPVRCRNGIQLTASPTHARRLSGSTDSAGSADAVTSVNSTDEPVERLNG